MTDSNPKIPRKPNWLKIKLPGGEAYSKVNAIVQNYGLHTICSSGNCPNTADCWGRGTATFMILGNICTRSCKFCAVATGTPEPVDNEEPRRVGESIKLMKLKHCVITSVDRDDLPDGGSAFWAETIKTIKAINPGITIEVLIPDFDGNHEEIKNIIDAKPEVISHNLETVKRLTPIIRSKAKYRTSLETIHFIASSGVTAKSGIMLGLGEKENEVLQTMDDLLEVGCSVFTIGQYLQPSRNHYPVIEYISPEVFERYKTLGKNKGFRFIESSPLVRSSYHAEKHLGD